MGGVEMRITVVLAWMEHFGLACDPRDPYHTRSHILYKLAAIEEHVRELVGRRVQLRSGEDVGRALFEDLSLPLPPGVHFRRKNNGRLAYKSSEEMLRQVAHPVVDQVLQHRRLSHALRRLEVLAESAAPARTDPRCPVCRGRTVSSRDDRAVTAAMGIALPEGGLEQPPLKRLRTELVQIATATGRLATA